MKRPARWAILLSGTCYLAVGIVTSALSSRAGSHQMVLAWRLAAWIVSALAYGAHIVFEHVRLHSTPRGTAWHVALGVALGGLGLAASANLHALARVQPVSPLMLLSLLIWPVMIALPAFVVALIVASVLAKLRGPAA